MHMTQYALLSHNTALNLLLSAFIYYLLLLLIIYNLLLLIYKPYYAYMAYNMHNIMHIISHNTAYGSIRSLIFAIYCCNRALRRSGASGRSANYIKSQYLS